MSDNPHSRDGRYSREDVRRAEETARITDDLLLGLMVQVARGEASIELLGRAVALYRPYWQACVPEGMRKPLDQSDINRLNDERRRLHAANGIGTGGRDDSPDAHARHPDELRARAQKGGWMSSDQIEEIIQGKSGKK